MCSAPRGSRLTSVVVRADSPWSPHLGPARSETRRGAPGRGKVSTTLSAGCEPGALAVESPGPRRIQDTRGTSIDAGQRADHEEGDRRHTRWMIPSSPGCGGTSEGTK